MSKVITALYETPAKAACAVDSLVAMGVPVKDISVLANDGVNVDEFTVETKSKVAEGTAIGAGTGGAIGALVAGFTAVGAIATGGAGLLVAGPLVSALAGAGAGAAAGSVIGAAAGLAIPEHEVRFYEEALDRGSVLIGVEKAGDRDDEVKQCLKDCDAIKVSTA